MTQRQFPSKDFPVFPEVSVEAGSEWINRNFPESVIGLIKTKEKAFSPNVLINIKKVEESYTFESNSAELADYTKNFKGLNIFANAVHEIDGRQWKIEEYAYVDERIGILAQLVAVTFIPIKDAKFMINFTGTVGLREEAKNKDYEEIQNMLRSVKIK
ncbi:hypothetical protein AB3331_11165 [Streptococcus sp. H49]|uniref:hypothetical protein n=1 Tax=Streptococcus huangxiaojuni TaxID=3237239 RepID=UPI0034A51479